jgi:hypothetical protein
MDIQFDNQAAIVTGAAPRAYAKGSLYKLASALIPAPGLRRTPTSRATSKRRIER